MSEVTNLKSIFWLTLIAAAISGIAAASPQPVERDNSSGSVGKADILIVYVSRTENTKVVAEMIHQELGGDMKALELETPYPEDYEVIVAKVDEENERGYLPPLKTRIDDIEDYDTIFLGFPTWDMQLPPPMKSFLHEYDLSGETVIPFNTHGGYGTGSSFRQVSELCHESNVLQGFSTKGGEERDGIYLAIAGERREEVHAEVMEWLRNIGML